MSLRQLASVVTALLALVATSSDARAATTWSVNYPERGTTRGFFDATSRSPIGNNNGKTLGEQRRIVFEAAVANWANVISSSVPLTIEATMVDLACDADGAILGQASATTAVVVKSPDGSGLAYPVALGNAIRETDLETASTDNPSGAEIVAEFNSAVGNADCLEGQAFYLGLDGKFGDDIDFFGIALHELAHGLGFATYLDLQTGEALFPDYPDAFSTHALDVDQNAYWSTMNATQLLGAIKKTRKIVWGGSHVTAAAPRFLVKGSPRLTVTPAVTGLSGMLGEHDDGPKLSEHPATGPLVVANPASGCSRPSNANKLNGAIALVDPKTDCHPLEAVGFMELSGAKAVIAIDPKSTKPPSMIVGILTDQTIPVVTIHRDDAAILSAQAVGRTVTLDGDMTRLVGTDEQGRVYLNATDPVLEESSISHWDPLTRDQLLMEPKRSAGHAEVDLTREFMRDLGWPVCGDGSVQGAEECDDGNATDFDGCDANCKKGQVRATSGSAGTGGSSSNSIASSTAGIAPMPDDGAGHAEATCGCRLPGSTDHERSLPTILGYLTLLALFRRRRG